MYSVELAVGSEPSRANRIVAPGVAHDMRIDDPFVIGPWLGMSSGAATFSRSKKMVVMPLLANPGLYPLARSIVLPLIVRGAEYTGEVRPGSDPSKVYRNVAPGVDEAIARVQAANGGGRTATAAGPIGRGRIPGHR